jgi:L-iditol 2-dehydrogenase
MNEVGEMEVKALQAVGINKLELTTFPRPEVQEQAVLIKILHCGVCGTDLHGIQGKRSIKFPIIPGHELVGVVGEIGSRALEVIKVYGGDLNAGDLVTINPRIICGKCYYCQNLPQRPEMCVGARTYNSTIRSDEPPHLFGGWAEYIYMLPGSEIIKLPPDIDHETASLAEPFACAVGMLDRYQKTHTYVCGDGFAVDREVVVFGVGAIGMCAAAAFHLAGARRIVAIDPIEKKLALARNFGATDVINSGVTTAEERIRRVKELSGGLGASIVVESCGVPSCIGEGIRMLRRGGTFFEMGHLVKTAPAEIDPLKVCRDELEIFGNYAYPSSQCLAYAAKLLKENKLPYKKLLKSFFLEDFPGVIFGDKARGVVKAVFSMR